MRKKQKISADNGVSISYKVEANERIKIPHFNEIMLTLLVIIASIGAVMTFSTILGLRVMPSVVIPFIVLFSVICTFLYKLIKKRQYLVIAGAAVLMGVIALLFIKQFSKGAVILFDQARVTISEAMGWEIPQPKFAWEGGFVYLTNFVTVLLSMVLCSAISYFTFVKQSFIAIFLLTFPFFEIGAAFGAVPNYTFFSFMIASWAAYLTTARATNAKIKMRRSNGQKQKKDIDGSKQKFAGIAVVMAISVVLLFTLLTTYLDAIGFTRGKNIDKLRTETQYGFEDFIDYVIGVDHDGSLKEGKLYQVDDRIIKNRHYLTMQTTLKSVKEAIKIRGYTATVYEDNRWNQTDAYDDYEEMFKDFKDLSYKIGVDTGVLIKNRADFTDMVVADITMSDFRRKKPYVYETYFADFSDDKYTPIYDNGIAPDSKSQYTYTTYLSPQYIYKVPESIVHMSKKYQEAFKEYTDFVNKEYVNSEATSKVKQLAMSFEASDRFELVSEIRAYLQDNIKHTKKSGKAPKNVDFVENFLFNTKKGYSTHFASAAAVLMQARGYPTRYVEGYYISSKNFNNTKTEHWLGYKTIDVTDKYAHAWIEVFDETYGWIPVEVTPGYWSSDVTKPKPKPSEPETEVENDAPTTTPENVIIPSIVEPSPPVDYNEVEHEVKDKLRWVYPVAITFFKIVVALAALLLVVTIIIYIIHLIIASVRGRIYNSDDVNKKLKFAYKYLSDLAGYQKFKLEGTHDYMGFAEYMGDKVFYITADNLKFIFNVFLKNAYSYEPASIEEANEVIVMLRNYSRRIYADLSKREKLIYKYILNL